MTSSNTSWLGKLSGLSPRSKYEARDPSPPPRRRGGSQQQSAPSSFRTKTALSLRPRSMSPFGLRRSRSRDNISESSFNVDDLRATEDGAGGDESSYAGSLQADAFSSLDGRSVDTEDPSHQNFIDSEVDSEVDDIADGYAGNESDNVMRDRSRRRGSANIEEIDFDLAADEPIDELDEDLKKTSPAKQSKQAIFEGKDAAFTIQGPSEVYPNGDCTESADGREEDHPLRASQVSIGLEDEDGEHLSSYHYQQKQQSLDQTSNNSPPSRRTSPTDHSSPTLKHKMSSLGTHIDIHGTNSTDLLDTQRMAYDAMSMRTPPPKIRSSNSPTSPTSSGKKKQSPIDLLDESKTKSRLNRFSRRPSGSSSPLKAPSAPPPRSPAVRDGRVSKRGSTPRGSSLDGMKKPPSSPPQSTYVKHLESEVETLRKDRSDLMKTILELKQENEENAQAAARIDNDNGDEKLSLSNRINELDEALQKANATIKLLRSANHTLKQELEEVKFDNHSMRNRLSHMESKFEREEEEIVSPRKRQSQSAMPTRTPTSKSKPPPPPSFSPPPTSANRDSVRNSHVFEEQVRSPSKRRTSQSMGRMSAPPAPPPPEVLQHQVQQQSDVTSVSSTSSRPQSPPSLPPPLPDTAQSPEQAPPPLPPPRSISRGRVNDKRELKTPNQAPPVPPPRSSSKTRKQSHFFPETPHESEDNMSENERFSTNRSSEGQLYQSRERKSEMRKSEPDNFFRSPDPSPNGRVSMRGPSPLSRNSRPSPVSSPRSRSAGASTSLKARSKESSGNRVSPRSSSVRSSHTKALSDVEEQLNESSIEKDDLKSRVNRNSPADARIVKEDEHVRGRASSRKQITRPPSPSPSRRPNAASPAKGSPMKAPGSPHSSMVERGSTPRSTSRRSLPRDSGMSDLLNYVPTPRLKNGTPRSRSHTPSSTSSSTRSSAPSSVSPRPTRSRSHTPSGSSSTVTTIPKANTRSSSSSRSGTVSSVNSMPTPWSAHPLAANHRRSSESEDGNGSSLNLLRTSPDFHPASPPKERPQSAFTTPTKNHQKSTEEMKSVPRRLSTTKKPPKPTTPLSIKKKLMETSPREITTRHSETSFALEDIHEKPFHQHRSKTRRSATGFTTEELENSIPLGRSFLSSNIVNTDDGMVAVAPTTTSTVSSSSSTSSSHQRSLRSSQSLPRPPVSSPPSTASTRKKGLISSSPPRFKETESVEEATARRLAYKEKCEREILEFQQSLQLEENGDEDLSYLKVQPRSNIVRRSASLDRERLNS